MSLGIVGDVNIAVVFEPVQVAIEFEREVGLALAVLASELVEGQRLKEGAGGRALVLCLA